MGGVVDYGSYSMYGPGQYFDNKTGKVLAGDELKQRLNPESELDKLKRKNEQSRMQNLQGRLGGGGGSMFDRLSDTLG